MKVIELKIFENWSGIKIIWKKTRVLRIIWKLGFWKIIWKWEFGKLNLRIGILENYLKMKIFWKLNLRIVVLKNYLKMDV